MQRMKLDHYLIPHTKINSKWVNDLNVRPETIKPLEKNMGSKFCDTSLGDEFLDLTPKAKVTKAKNKEVGLHQTKNLLHSKGNHQQSKKVIC